MLNNDELRALLEDWEATGHTDETVALRLSLAMWQWMKGSIKKTGKPVYKPEWTSYLGQLFPDLGLSMPESQCYLCEFAFKMMKEQPYCSKCPASWNEKTYNSSYPCRNGEYGEWWDEMKESQDLEKLLSGAEAIISCIERALEKPEKL